MKIRGEKALARHQPAPNSLRLSDEKATQMTLKACPHKFYDTTSLERLYG